MKIGFIGLGDVGSRVSSGICKNGAETYGFDLRFGEEKFAEKEQRCIEHGVKFTQNIQELVDTCDLLISVTSCSQAIETLETALPHLRPGQYYCDLNSAVPTVKNQMKPMVEQTGAYFVDGGIMDSPLNGWERIPIALSGTHAQKAVDELNSHGMNTFYVGEKIGQASALKTLRSIFTKGLEALLIETFSSAYNYGVMDDIYNSIQQMFARDELTTMFERMIATDVVHAERRAKEIGGVADMLEADNYPNTMSRAAYEKLMWAVRTGVKDHFDQKVPADYREAVRFFAAQK